MITTLLLAIGAICLVLGILALLSVVSLPASTLLIVAVICLIAGIVLRGGAHRL